MNNCDTTSGEKNGGEMITTDGYYVVYPNYDGPWSATGPIKPRSQGLEKLSPEVTDEIDERQTLDADSISSGRKAIEARQDSSMQPSIQSLNAREVEPVAEPHVHIATGAPAVSPLGGVDGSAIQMDRSAPGDTVCWNGGEGANRHVLLNGIVRFTYLDSCFSFADHAF